MNPVFDGKVKQPPKRLFSKTLNNYLILRLKSVGRRETSEDCQHISIIGILSLGKVCESIIKRFVQSFKDTTERTNVRINILNFENSSRLSFCGCRVPTVECLTSTRVAHSPPPIATAPPGGVVDDSLNYRSDGDEAFAYII